MRAGDDGYSFVSEVRAIISFFVLAGRPSPKPSPNGIDILKSARFACLANAEGVHKFQPRVAREKRATLGKRLHSAW